MALPTRLRRIQPVMILVLAFILVSASHGLLDHTFNFDGQIQLAAQRYGARGQQNLQEWRDTMRLAAGKDEQEKIALINGFINSKIVYTEDSVAWGVEDYWATPVESLGRGVGDCEDYAIDKYFSLLILGIPMDKLRFVYVKAQMGGKYSSIYVAHMVLAYYPTVESEPLILDSLIDEIKPASQRPDLTPVFSFNSGGLWLGANTGNKSIGSSTSRLSRWRDVLARMHADGFE